MIKVLTCPVTWESCTRGCDDTGRCALRAAAVKRGERCGCAHPFDPHVLVATEFGEVSSIENVPVAGVVLCPECECAMTWSVAGRPVPPMPAPWELDLLRRDMKTLVGNAHGEVKEQDD